MAVTVNEYLALIRPYLSQALVSEESCSQIRALAGKLPGSITGFFGFECQLGIPAANADFLFCVRSNEPGQAILAGRKTRQDLPEAFYAESAWARIRTFCSGWIDPNSDLHENVDNIWLEFDLDAPLSDIPIPSFFFGAYNSLFSHKQHHWVTDQALDLLLGEALSAATRTRLLHCLQALPGKAYVFQIGAMLARKTDAVRICIRDIDPALVLPYLSEIKWPGRAADLDALLEQLSTFVNRVDIDLDIGANIGTKVGMECCFNRQPQFESGWTPFLDYLVHKDLCLSQKREALLQYPGYVHKETSPDLWPEDLRQTSDGTLDIIFRQLHHIKVVYQPEKPLEAKAYLAVSHIKFDKNRVKLARALGIFTSPRRHTQDPEP